jgi:hypothetical protein
LYCITTTNSHLPLQIELSPLLNPERNLKAALAKLNAANSAGAYATPLPLACCCILQKHPCFRLMLLLQLWATADHQMIAMHHMNGYTTFGLLTADRKELDWQGQYEALTDTRRAVRFHADLVRLILREQKASDYGQTRVKVMGTWLGCSNLAAATAAAAAGPPYDARGRLCCRPGD